MTEETNAAPWSPQWIRATRFPQRRRGYDEAEVDGFLHAVAAQIQRQWDVEASLRSEIARLEGMVSSDDVQTRAVDLFSQAQLVADQLIAEAVQHAQDMMSAARNQEREILGRASGAAGSARPAAEHRPRVSGAGNADVEYVNTYAKVVAVQLRSVVEALSEQVDRLSEIPDEHTASADSWGQSAAPFQSGTQNSMNGFSDLESDFGHDEGEPLIWASMMPPPAAREPGW